MGSLADTTNLTRLAEHLYDYLPGSSRWPQVFTFEHAAEKANVQDFWIGGSKFPALTNLLERTYQNRRSQFCALIVAIVSEGIKYRKKKGNPISRADLDELNKIIESLHFKIPDLWDPKFRNNLPEAKPLVSTTLKEPDLPTHETFTQRTERISELRKKFLTLQTMSDRQEAGRQLELFLTNLFEEFNLKPRRGFRVIGEQIDGSFLLHQQVYLVEAKWTGQVREADLLVFRGKMEGKAAFTRGLFISINGYTSEALEAITRGKQPNFIMIDGAHLYRILKGYIGLDSLLDRLVRLLGEEGRPYLPASELFS